MQCGIDTKINEVFFALVKGQKSYNLVHRNVQEKIHKILK
jgi:hypothetical protein